MSITTDLKMAYHMGYDDALAKRKPDASKVHMFGHGTCHELLPCPFCGAKAEVWQDYKRTWGLIEHKPDCWLAYDIPRHKQEIPRAEFDSWNRRADHD